MVIKLGGSIYHTEFLEDWLNTIADLNATSVIVVPGGGIFADQVRAAAQRYYVSENTSHRMALLAMQQYGEFLCGLNENFEMAKLCDFDQVSGSGHIPVWAPFEDVCQWFDGPQTWQTTSDSLSLWLATHISCDSLYIIKSAYFDPRSSHAKLVEEGILDEQFVYFSALYQGDISLLHVSEYASFTGQD